jgi:N utilization substance protein B
MQKKSPRHLARSLAVQAIYAYKLNNSVLQIAIEDYLNNINPEVYQKANNELMHYLIEQGISEFDQLLELYIPYLQRELNQINLIEQVILVIASLEFTKSATVPAAVIINEAIELAKLYGAEDSYKFINGLVDKLANQVRHDEMNRYLKVNTLLR